MKEYRDLFLAESAKNIARIEAILEERGEEPVGGTVEALFREFHSYKGMAGTMRFESMAKFAHRIEDALDLLRGSSELDGGTRALLFKCVDRLSAMRENVAAGGAGEIDWSDIFASGGQAAEQVRQEDDEVMGHSPGKPMKVTVAIDPDCPTPAARAYLIVNRFRENFPQLQSQPPQDELMKGVRTDKVRMTLPEADRAEVIGVYDTLTEVAGLFFDEDRKPKVAASPVQMDSRAILPETIEVDSSTLDGLVDLVGELTLMTGRMREISGAIEGEALRDESRKLESLVRALDERVMAMRCFPFSTVGGRLRRFVREEAEKLGKKARLTISGGQIGVDKGVMLRLSGPLTHLLRNSLDHGLENPEMRLKAGKSEEGAIEIALERSRNLLRISIFDDGAGIDTAAVARTAAERGLASADQVGCQEPDSIYRFVFMPGFSTRSEVGSLSGRGVGLDAVASEIAAMGGEIRVESNPGKGTRFELNLPISPAISPALTLEAGGFALALPVFSVSSTFECAQGELSEDSEGLWAERGGERLKVRYLADLIGSDRRPDPKRLAVVVVEKGGCRTCLAADRLVREEYLYVKPFRGMWERLAGVSGYSVTGDGRVVYLLDPSWLCGE